jgi:predicted porin
MKEMRLKKKLLAMALMSVAGAASAQSSVTLFGIVDATVSWGKGEGPGSTTRTQLTHSAYSPSRLGFRGTEDLGGGLSASFWLEAGFANDDGRAGTAIAAGNQGITVAANTGLNFGRRSTVSLAGGWGEVRLGRDYTPQFWTLTFFDPFGTNGVGTSQAHVGSGALNGATQVRASNSVGYFLPPNLGGIYGQVQYYLGENPKDGAATERDGSGGGIRLGYASGPFNVVVATGYTRYAAGGVHQSNIGAQWSFGFGRILGMVERDSAGAAEGRGWVFGGVFPVGVGEVRASVSRYTTDPVAGPDPRSTKLALGYVHHLSKRTALYTTVARVKNSNGAAVALAGSTTAPDSSSSGLDLGIRHAF